MTNVATSDTLPGATTSKPRPVDVVGVLSDYVGRRAAGLQAGYQADRPTAVSALARLRRALVANRELDADAWEIFEGMPEPLMGSGDAPSRAEYAAVAALSLFATHQQSRRDAGMHAPGRDHSLGRAVGALARASQSQGVERRFRALTRTGNVTAAVQHLRGLVTQLRGARIPVDYGALAADLYRLQVPQTGQSVRMRWTRDYHRPGNDSRTATADQSGERT